MSFFHVTRNLRRALGATTLSLLALNPAFARAAEEATIAAPTTPAAPAAPFAPATTSTTSASANVPAGYRRELVDEALRRERLVPDPAPAGKIIEDIRVVTYDVIDFHDPWPHWASAVHAKTEPEVVRRELLFEKGSRWDPAVVAETERNLRAYLFVSTAEITPVRGSAADRVIALVVAKDIWSLRSNIDFTLVDSTWQRFELELTEQNLGGWNRKVSLDAVHDLWTNSVGASYADPRLGGSRVAVSGSAAVIFGLSDGRTEGGAAALSFKQPLYRLSSEWAWNVAVDARRSIYRLPQGVGIASFIAPSTGEAVPYTYLQRTASALASVTRSYGSALKQNVAVGWRAILQHYEFAPGVAAANPGSLIDFATNALPRSEDAGALFVEYHLYRPEYSAAIDLDTFAFTEDVKLGPDVLAELRLANPIFGFSSRYLQATSTASWIWRLGTTSFAGAAEGDDYFKASLGGGIRNQPGVLGGSDWIERSLTATASNFSPRFGPFRLVTSARATRRAYDAFHTLDILGGDNALRGYPVGYFVGANSVAANAELRTRPVRLASIHVGAAAFLDVGDAFDDPSAFALHASAGAGLRAVFPEFTRDVLRLDLGVPLENGPGLSPFSVVLRFGQAF